MANEVTTMQTTRLISALATAVLVGTVQSVAPAQTQPSTAPTTQTTTSPVTTPTKSPTDVMTPDAVPATAAPGAGMHGPGTPGMNGPLALNARNLRARRTATGYVLTGQAQVIDACQAARFDPSMLTIYPPQYDLHQFRAPGKMGMLCIQRLMWIAATPRTVPSTKPPAYITVRTQKGATRVPIR